MKLDAAFARSLLMFVMVGMSSLSLTAQTQEKAEAPSGAADSAVPGTMIPREKGGFLGLVIEGGAFKLSFYDADKKPVAPDVARAAARWKPSYKIGDERRVLNPGSDGQSLVSAPLRAPYQFKLYLTLLSEKGEAVEHYVFDFKE